MASGDYVCEQCREPVAQSASVCPHCGYGSSDGHKLWWWVHLIASLILIGTIIGIPLAIPFMRKGRAHRKAANATPATPA